MSEGPELIPEVRAWMEAWKNALQQVLTQVLGKPLTLEISGEVPAADSDMWYTVTAEGGARGEMTFRVPAESGSRMAQIFMGDTEPQAKEPAPEFKEALEELLRQVAGIAATSMELPGGKVQFQLAASSAPSWPAAASAAVHTPGDVTIPLSIAMQLSAAMAASLQAKPSAKPAPAIPDAPPETGSYQRLMDVGLEVNLRFGTRRMVLRDVLSLSTGTVVELDRAISAPVDLLLDGRVIARGEVVVVDGKYGLKITDVVDAGSAA